MSTHNSISAPARDRGTALSSTRFAQSDAGTYGFGTTVDPQELAKYFAIPPDGRGLPPGSGNCDSRREGLCRELRRLSR